MIILISGNSCTGKTYMAQQLLERYHAPYLSIDHLKMGLYRADMNCGFTPLDSTEFIGEKLWPILKEIIKTNIENNQNLIIEGCYILPHYLQDIEPSYLAHIIPVFLGFSTTYIQQNSNPTSFNIAMLSKHVPFLKKEPLLLIYWSMRLSVKSVWRQMCLILKLKKTTKKRYQKYMITSRVKSRESRVKSMWSSL